MDSAVNRPANLIWIVGGFIFSALPIEKVRGEHKVAEWTSQPMDPSRVIPLKIVAERAGLSKIKSADLGTLLGRPVWRISVDNDHAGHNQIITLDGRNGRKLSPINEALARQIAKADYIGPGQLISIVYDEDPPTEYPHAGAAWIAEFDDFDKTSIYINPESGLVKSRRSRTWRLFDFFWRLHVMDYDDGANFNHPLLIISSLIALIVALSGLVLLLIRVRRKLKMMRA